jgi:HAD superfamily hydrolase (TIGR01549 family)
MANASGISTVFFDYGDTLVENRPTYLRRVTEMLGEFGYVREHADVVSAYTNADYMVYLDISAGTLGSDGRYLIKFLDYFGQNLDIEIDWATMLPEISKKFAQSVFERILSPGTIETLEALKAKDCRLGVISNNDGTCHRKCEEMGIGKYFDIIIDSTVEGVGKPSPIIFERALERMGVSPGEAAHVGDMYGADVLGARDAGLAPVWYNPRGLKPMGEYRPEHEVDRLVHIAEMV